MLGKNLYVGTFYIFYCMSIIASLDASEKPILKEVLFALYSYKLAPDGSKIAFDHRGIYPISAEKAIGNPLRIVIKNEDTRLVADLYGFRYSNDYKDIFGETYSLEYEGRSLDKLPKYPGAKPGIKKD